MRKELLVMGTALMLGACADSSLSSGPSRLAPLAQSGNMSTQLVADEYLVVLQNDVSDVAGASRVSGAAVLSQWPPISAGCRRPWNNTKRRSQSTYASSILRL